MTIFLFAFPDASEDEIAACLYDHTNNVYTRKDISSRLKKLKLTRKKASTEAFATFTPESLQRARKFWSQSPPVGVSNVPRHQLIDMDEAAFTLETVNRTRVTSIEKRWGTMTQMLALHVGRVCALYFISCLGTRSTALCGRARQLNGRSPLGFRNILVPGPY